MILLISDTKAGHPNVKHGMFCNKQLNFFTARIHRAKVVAATALVVN